MLSSLIRRIAVSPLRLQSLHRTTPIWATSFSSASTPAPAMANGDVSSNLSYSREEASALTDEEWSTLFAEDVSDIRSDVHFEDSANRLRQLVMRGLLRPTDLLSNPERFFLAHRILGSHSSRLGPGFWIRFTVHFNLFAGTVIGLGSEKQIAFLDEMQKKGELGCFGLTEKLAGVNSGLVVNTTATWDQNVRPGGGFIINSPNEASQKNWISAGYTADHIVAVADLRDGSGKSYGPHAFLLRMREEGNGDLLEGITIGDMGVKTIGNDLDNVWVNFDNVVVEPSTLLNKFADVNPETGLYEQKTKVRTFEMIGQRLFTGRIAVAQAALAFQKALFHDTRTYSDAKRCWSPGLYSTDEGDLSRLPVLSDIPQLSSLYKEAETITAELDEFVKKCEIKLNDCLKSGKLPPVELQEAIAVCKVKAVETCIDLCFRLKQEVGSYALMGGTGFENTDFLQCAKFAEGDSRILMLKMARDEMRAYHKGHGEKYQSAMEKSKCEELTRNIETLKNSGASEQQAWTRNWETVYELAEASMDRVYNNVMKEK
eukprot:g2336.t1